MAKLNEEMIVIKISKLLRDDEKATAMLDAEMSSNLEAVIQELTGPDKLVEIIKEQPNGSNNHNYPVSDYVIWNKYW